MKAYLAWAAAWCMLIFVRTAAACPACAGRDDGVGLKLLPVYALLVMTPFLATGAVIRIIRRLPSTAAAPGEHVERRDGA